MSVPNVVARMVGPPGAAPAPASGWHGSSQRETRGAVNWLRKNNLCVVPRVPIINVRRAAGKKLRTFLALADTSKLATAPPAGVTDVRLPLGQPIQQPNSLQPSESRHPTNWGWFPETPLFSHQPFHVATNAPSSGSRIQAVRLHPLRASLSVSVVRIIGRLPRSHNSSQKYNAPAGSRCAYY